LARALANYKGGEMLSIFANGCCGNINHRHIQWTGNQTSQSEAIRLGSILAGAVLRSYPNLEPLKGGKIAVRSELLELPLPPIDGEDIRLAEEVVKRMDDPKTTFMEKVKAFQVLDVKAREGKKLEVEVQVIAWGDEVAFVSLPGEIFVELGLSIKEASPFRYTSLVELANGSIGYIPNRPAYQEGNYEVVSARCGAGAGEMLVSSAIKMLEALHKEAQSGK
jgi:neutral ceramidase